MTPFDSYIHHNTFISRFLSCRIEYLSPIFSSLSFHSFYAVSFQLYLNTLQAFPIPPASSMCIKNHLHCFASCPSHIHSAQLPLSMLPSPSPFTTHFLSICARTWNNTPNSLHSQPPGILEFHNNRSCLNIIIFIFFLTIRASHISSFLLNRNGFTFMYVYSYTTAIGWHSTIHCPSIDLVCILPHTATIIHHLTFRLHHLHLTHFFFSKHHSIHIPISIV